MGVWTNINDSNDRFRLLCENKDCSLSIANLINGMLHVSTLHNNQRHSIAFNNQDMRFIVSQYLNNLSLDERQEMLQFFKNF